MERSNIFVHVPAIVAGLSAYSIVVAVLYNYGFLSVFNLQYLTLLSLTDQIQNSIIIMPVCFYSLLGLVANLKMQQLSITNGQIRKRYLFAYILICLLYIICRAFYKANNGTIFLPSLTSAAFVSISSMWAVFLVLKSKFQITNTQKMIFATIPLSLVLPFLMGEMDAKRTINKRRVNNIYINNELKKNARIIRYLERGILFYDDCSLDLELINWSEIKSIKYKYNIENKTDCPTKL